MKRNDGTKLQNLVKDALDDFYRKQPAYALRLQDSRANFGWVQVQPGDFIFLIPGNAVLLECKSTESGLTLHEMRATSSASQNGKHKLWRRAGHSVLHIFGDMLADVVEVWNKDSLELTSDLKNIPTILEHIYVHHAR